ERGTGGPVEQVIAEQLRLMTQQLQMLRGTPAEPIKGLTPPARQEVTPDRGDHDWSPRQQRFLRELIARYTRRTANSKAHVQEHRRTHADPRTASGFTKAWKELVYPIVVERSAGSRLWDIDGNEYIDLLNGFGPDFLGHSPPVVIAALQKQLELG